MDVASFGEDGGTLWNNIYNLGGVPVPFFAFNRLMRGRDTMAIVTQAGVRMVCSVHLGRYISQGEGWSPIGFSFRLPCGVCSGIDVEEEEEKSDNGNG